MFDLTTPELISFGVELLMAVIGTSLFAKLFDRVNALPQAQTGRTLLERISQFGDRALPVIDMIWSLYGPERFPLPKIIQAIAQVTGQAATIETPADFAELLDYVDGAFSPSAYARVAKQGEAAVAAEAVAIAHKAASWLLEER